MTSFHTLILSLIVHIGLLWLIAQAPPLEPPKNVPVDIVYLDKNAKEPKKDRQFVTDPELGKKLEELNKKAKYLSRYSRRVKEEMIARQNGVTKNALKPELEQKKSQNKKTALQQKIREEILQDPDALKVRRQDSAQNALEKRLQVQSSTIAEYIPNVAEGGLTALNTDQFLFYSFFSRINEQIRFRWVSYIRNYSSQLTIGDMKRLSQRRSVTEVDIKLNKKGDFINATIYKSSGDENLDLAAINAFKNAAPLMNPPQELIEEDGYIHLIYSFYIQWQSRNLVSD